MNGPLSRALKGSYLAASVRGGIQALPGEKRRHLAEAIRPDFADSLDLDTASKSRHPTDPRWDYLLGHAASFQIVAVETHPADTSQVASVILKRTATLGHLRDQLTGGDTVAAWYWAASGRVDFVPHERTILRLAQSGIEFVGGRLEAKHLTKLRGLKEERKQARKTSK